MSLTSDQQRVVDSFLSQKVTVVAAGAGSGKTHTVVVSFLKLIEQGASPGDFILITFTRAAASELRGRLMAGLLKRLEEAELADKHRWRKHLQELSGAFIGTIHSFCREILSAYGYEIDVPHMMNISFSALLKEEAIQEVVSDHLQTLRVDKCSDTETDKYGNPDGLLISADASPLHERQLVQALSHVYETILNLSWKPEEILDVTRNNTPRRDPGTEGYLRVLLVELIVEAHQRYQVKKRDRAMIDSADMLTKTYELFSKDEIGPKIIESICNRWRYLIIDEFQDTDEMQLNIVRVLLTNLDKLMVVGDRKQSIYGFRGANNTLLMRLAREVYQQNNDLIESADPLPLSNSARPTIELLNAINHIFGSARIGCDVRGMDFSMLNQPLTPMNNVSFEANDGLEAVVMVPYEDQGAHVDAVERYLTAYLGTEFQYKNPAKVKDGETGKKPIEYSDIVILTRTNHAAISLHDQCLERGIPTVLVKGDAFYQNQAIIDIYRLLQIVLESPVLSGLHFLQGSIFDVENTFADICHTYSNDELADNLPSEFVDKLIHLKQFSREHSVPQLLLEIYDQFGLLDSPTLHHTQDEDGHPVTVQQIELDTRLYYRLYEIARDLFQQEHALSVMQFVDYLRLSIESARTESEPIQHSGTPPNLIRIMTIHASKGLEFPVVIIPEMSRRLTRPALMKQGFLPSHNFVFEQSGVQFASFYGVFTSDFFSREEKRDNSNRLWLCSGDYMDQYETQLKPLLLREEMQVLYVAITRAQHQVVLLEEDTGYDSERTGVSYCWQAEFDDMDRDIVDPFITYLDIGD